MASRDYNRAMPKRSSSKDEVQNALRVVEEAIGQPLAKKNRAAVALGRRGGLKGGKARAEKLTSEQRREIAQKAAQERWKRARKAAKIKGLDESSPREG